MMEVMVLIVSEMWVDKEIIREGKNELSGKLRVRLG